MNLPFAHLKTECVGAAAPAAQRSEAPLFSCTASETLPDYRLAAQPRRLGLRAYLLVAEQALHVHSAASNRDAGFV
jgi:hypothetical protein